MNRRKGRGKAVSAPKEKKHVRGREMTPALISALDHPVRREILRLLSGQDTPVSPVEMKDSIDVGLSALSYHARTLAEQRVTRLSTTRQVRGSTQHFYASEVAENRMVTAILAHTEKYDSFLRP
jgi:DNA-binding transcriptional ArsR family regulator